MSQSKETQKSLNKSPVLSKERKLERNEDMEKRLSFFSILAKTMLEMPTKDNLEALQRENDALSHSCCSESASNNPTP
ncbi:Uncharacterised protein [Legionella busanensis]|uniref:Uncharacterized protein n=1 Tax=Legionella busanensis TaxID=190655 RepID=A0A378JL41_9GAMM|nr:hypothetical protein [Legionella busanensis]STX51451.1 Uncharacterised protein [Legionella busanensis]